VPVDGREAEADALVAEAEAPHRIPPGRLHLDHRRAEVGERQSGERPGHVAGGLHDLHAVERAHRTSPESPSWLSRRAPLAQLRLSIAGHEGYWRRHWWKSPVLFRPGGAALMEGSEGWVKAFRPGFAAAPACSSGPERTYRERRLGGCAARPGRVGGQGGRAA